ncbi:MAG TPA: hypothetical protein VJ976_10220, partial [Ornithinimicrobium sp.]|uniref:hypothetical protein n=1 Tax=Ornithinimicrobium sp. TaxID=1977084 RepID=UPI002B476933
MRQEPHRLLRRVIGVVVVCTFLAAAVTYPLVAPDGEEPTARATATAPDAPVTPAPEAEQRESEEEAQGVPELAGPGIVMVVSPS